MNARQQANWAAHYNARLYIQFMAALEINTVGTETVL